MRGMAHHEKSSILRGMYFPLLYGVGFKVISILQQHIKIMHNLQISSIIYNGFEI